ncbi:MAG: hypothetical protein P9X24_16950 [Candidatus Hatepunaea meridiana]|nr:hypothetical protein [Candidatus Hatepunaea meridiana]
MTRQLHFKTQSMIWIILLSLAISQHFAYCVPNNLQQIRVCQYFDAARNPTKLRIALDFEVEPEKMVLVKTDKPNSNVPKGFVNYFKIVAKDKNKTGIIVPANIVYVNTKMAFRFTVSNNEIHVAASQTYPMDKSTFKYIPKTKVAYIDLKFIGDSEEYLSEYPVLRKQRSYAPQGYIGPPMYAVSPETVYVKQPVYTSTAKPETVFVMQSQQQIMYKTPGDSDRIQVTLGGIPIDVVKEDTVVIEKLVYDTLYEDTLFVDRIEIVTDTIHVEKVIYVEKGKEVNELMGINCENYVNWWNDPHIKLDFQFKLHTIKLAMEPSNKKILDAEPGYTVQYVIYPFDQDSSNTILFHNEVPINYSRSSEQILVKMQENKCYLLANEGFIIRPHEFVYDDNNRLVYIRLRY